MKATSAVRDIMEKKGIGLMELAEKTGKSKQATWERLSQKNISVVKLDELLKVVGYKIVLIPEEVKLNDNWYEVDDSRGAEAPTPVGKE